jgi:hypothetical protein
VKNIREASEDELRKVINTKQTAALLEYFNLNKKSPAEF